MTGLAGDPYQVLTDCGFCLVEAAVVEVMDPLHPACHLGIPAERRCRMCTWTELAVVEPFSPRMPLSAARCPACNQPLSESARTGLGACGSCGYLPTIEQTRSPADLTIVEVARHHLARWAEEEGSSSSEEFTAANMGLSTDQVIALLGRRERVPTTFDVIAYLFPSQGGGAAQGAIDPHELGRRPTEVVDREPVADPEAPPPPVAPTSDPRTAARVLVSVMLADGELRAGERRFIDRYLAAEQLTPLTAADLRVWRPPELPPPADPAVRRQLLEAAVHLAHLDHQRDGSEWKVITAFARAWGITEDELDAWDRRYERRYATAMTLLWRSLSGLVRIH